ncbi:MAG: hypothetical protein FWD23_04380 [Oscillospiraceae bacterium]|nr:hypothetical protein [Oscillospiraceae bacterium]
MRKCPKCLKYGETETTRFCSKCGTELFFEERFENNSEGDIKKNNTIYLKNIYGILALAGVIIWSAAIFLRETPLMDNAVFRRILWVAPNFGVVWAGIGFTFMLFPRIFKREFEPKHTLVLVGGIFALLILSEGIHHFFLDSPFDIWDMAASAAASIVVLVIYFFRLCIS